MTGLLEQHLRDRRDGGHKLLIPYITGGLTGQWTDAVEAAVAAGADAVEIGIPFSDPVMDGPTIQEASDRALADGATPMSVLDDVRRLEVDVPLAVMTYYNLAFHSGLQRFAASLHEAGVSAAILPDMPLEECEPWAEAAGEAGVEMILLAAPTAPDDRLPRICERTQGFVYGVGLLGVTGERAELAASATEMAVRLKAVTDVPVLVGVGVSTPAQAVEVCAHADGVIVGSAVVRRLLDGHGPEGVGDLVREFRTALDR
ncbi:MAG: tryptophan synthase subunit alpha [Acidimicrobiales bacterium]